ncbi:MAG: mycothiol conjugate amidase Mca [Actinobacteria bacterium]|nr:mycothiol conjugate amidase Mca [Actinomycetota bacterium]
MTRRLMFVHAHPDDESSKGAATAARYVDEGAEVVLVTCTGGEAGEVLNPACEDVPPERMSAMREAELAAAVGIIGFTRTHQLGFHDSGYHEDPAGVPEGTFARTPVDEPATKLAEVIRAERPHVLVTYPEDGGYPHPDHIMCHEVSVRAVELAEVGDLAGEPWRVPKVYACTAFPPERVLALHEGLLARGLESPFEGWMERRAERDEAKGEPAALIDVGDWLTRRDDALRAHVTQVDPDGFWFQVPRDLERSAYPYEAYLRIRADVATEEPEDDLFAGLDV